MCISPSSASMDCIGGVFFFPSRVSGSFPRADSFHIIYEKIRMIRCKRILKKDLIHPSLPTIMYTV